MTSYELEFMNSVTYSLKKIVRELKRANELKALELKGRQDLNLSPEMVDDVVEDE